MSIVFLEAFGSGDHGVPMVLKSVPVLSCMTKGIQLSSK